MFSETAIARFDRNELTWRRIEGWRVAALIVEPHDGEGLSHAAFDLVAASVPERTGDFVQAHHYQCAGAGDAVTYLHYCRSCIRVFGFRIGYSGAGSSFFRKAIEHSGVPMNPRLEALFEDDDSLCRHDHLLTVFGDGSFGLRNDHRLAIPTARAASFG